MRGRTNKNLLLQFIAALAAVVFVISVNESRAASRSDIEALFTVDARNQLVLEIEAAIAEAQAAEGVIPKSAAREIAAKAQISYAPSDEIAEEYKKVRHRMVALLNVWKRSLDDEAKDYVHFGVTTVDIYDTVKVLQLKKTIEFLISDMRDIEQSLMDIAIAHRDTPMVGRTLGQHALPITFGKKAAVWVAANRRNINRLKEVHARLDRLGVLKGAVGTHLGLGPDGEAIEKRVAARLGLSEPEPADWRGVRDVFAEYALTLGLIAKSYAGLGGEVFRLQMTDIGEVYERRPPSAVGSSTMPHKRNPSRSEALVHYGRTIPRKAEILLDDVENAFERDNTSRPNRILEEISLEAARMVQDAGLLIRRLEIDEAAMRRNLAKTDGMFLSQRLVFALSDSIGREQAEEKVREAALLALNDGISFRDALLADDMIYEYLAEQIDELLNPGTYLGLAGRQVDRTVSYIMKERKKDRSVLAE